MVCTPTYLSLEGWPLTWYAGQWDYGNKWSDPGCDPGACLRSHGVQKLPLCWFF
jgi:hypothetical protein